MAFKDEIIADMQATISRLTGELVERSSFEFKLMERISFLQQQLQKIPNETKRIPSSDSNFKGTKKAVSPPK